ncbi:hypothetical protein NE235_02310 [Actinoallomurus spadix]|uniref:Streptomyces killer toxin-like beta/gamma crystallin domain-containing protein n=1 Tax=Actinoallomurus spadix TaxID=79912 RepID=A0ABP3HEF0_9ACTN|nr:beta/gamma crystallin domain-containing protein [Actinoallomurus spadix]MCO5984936.1 hypothetical protein [Actinoallomurus spadix]
MFSASRKSIKRFGITAGAAALFLSLIPGQAFAIDQVSCDSSDYVHVWWHLGSEGGESCFANAGQLDNAFGDKVPWVDKVSTGNNVVYLLDENGETPFIPRYTIISYPNRPIHTRGLFIRPDYPEGTPMDQKTEDPFIAPENAKPYIAPENANW